jgi:hypothetical protein
MSQASPFAHLDAAAMTDFMDRYYAGEPTETLMAAFDIDCSPNRLWEYFPPEVTTQACPNCGTPLQRPRCSRTRVEQQPLAQEPLRCGRCPHEDRPECACPACAHARTQAETAEHEQRTRALIAKRLALRYPDPITAADPSLLSVREAITLLGLVRCGGWSDAQTIGPLKDAPLALAPQAFSLEERLLSEDLERPGLATLSPQASALTAFVVHHEERISWTRNAVHWSLRLVDPSGYIRRLERLVTSDAWPPGPKPTLTLVANSFHVQPSEH